MILQSLLFPLLFIAIVCALYFFKRWEKEFRHSEPADAAKHVTYAGAVKSMIENADPRLKDVMPNLPKKAAVSEGEDITESEAADGGTDIEESGNTAPGPDIFRAYDIRGIAGKTLRPATVHTIGKAIGSIAADRDQQVIAVGRDGRNSSPDLAQSLIEGLRTSGRDVIDIGMAPTPVLYFATHHLKTASGVMVTGSHNPAEYNGLKIMLGGSTLFGDGIQAVYQRSKEENSSVEPGALQTSDISDEYIRKIVEDTGLVADGAQKIVIDAGNGVAGAIAPALFRALGHEVVELYCDIDGAFPNHPADPSQPENLQALIGKVKEEKADIGFAFDGDGDRLGVVDASGTIIWPDRQLMLLAKDVLSRNQGAVIIFDVKCSHHLGKIIQAHGGKPLMWKTGHSYIKDKMKEENAPLAGEMSGHIFFKERWYGFDDALYAGARILEIIGKAEVGTTELFASLPDSVSTPEIKIDLAEEEHAAFMDMFGENMSFDDAKIVDIDGFRVEFSDGWGLIRPSNTTPCIIVRFEADSEAALEEVKSRFRSVIQSVNPELTVSF